MIRSIYNPHQFSVLSLIGITTLVALVSVRNSFGATIFAIELIALHIFVAGLIGNLPGRILAGMHRNCMRHDGTFDPMRLSVEKKELRSLYWQVLILCAVLFLVPINWAFWHFKPQTLSEAGEIFALGFVWFLCGSVLLGTSYIRLLKHVELRSVARNESYWIQDTALPVKTPFDD